MTYMVVFRKDCKNGYYTEKVGHRDPQKAMGQILKADPWYFKLVDGFQFYDDNDGDWENLSPRYYIDGRIFVEVDGTDKVVVTRNGKVQPFKEDNVFLKDPYK